jgi:hypothetical protein
MHTTNCQKKIAKEFDKYEVHKMKRWWPHPPWGKRKEEQNNNKKKKEKKTSIKKEEERRMHLKRIDHILHGKKKIGKEENKTE